MNPKTNAVRLGVRRGCIEFVHSLKNSQDVFWNIFTTGILILVLWLQRNATVEGMPLAMLSLPGLLGMSVASGGLMGVAGILSYDREDGTLLRAKATPQGMFGYLVARIVYVTLTTLLSMVILFVPALLFIDGLTSIGLGGLSWFFVFFIVGLLATAPIGAITGSLVKTSGSGFGLSFLPLAALGAISGIFYPISSMSSWLQDIAQIFPVYWLAHGMRYAFLPDGAAVAELGGAWRPGLGLAVLAAWMVVGLLITPRILKRMARKVSGSEMQSRKEQMMQRGY